jgi:transcriptional regulator GlxA family with amidase domain
MADIATDPGPLAVGMVLFPGVTQLDLTGPYEVFCRMPNTKVHLLAATDEPVRSEFGLTIAPELRVVIDRNRITGGGVTAGIDLALVIAAQLFGAAKAREIQLAIEYDPAPPFDGGSPRTAPDDVRQSVLRASGVGLAARKEILARIARHSAP